MSLEIFKDTLLKLILRNGTDVQRTRVTLDIAEPGYTVDGKRLYVGDGVTPGGNVVGNLFKGTRPNVTDGNINNPVPGDFAFGTVTSTLYRFISNSPLDINNWEPIATYLPPGSYNPFTAPAARASLNPHTLTLSSRHNFLSACSVVSLANANNRIQTLFNSGALPFIQGNTYSAANGQTGAFLLSVQPGSINLTAAAVSVSINNSSLYFNTTSLQSMLIDKELSVVAAPFNNRCLLVCTYVNSLCTDIRNSTIVYTLSNPLLTPGLSGSNALINIDIYNIN